MRAKLKNRNDVRILFLRKGATVTGIVSDMRMNLNTYYAIINGKIRPKDDFNSYIKKKLGVSMNDIIEAWKEVEKNAV